MSKKYRGNYKGHSWEAEDLLLGNGKKGYALAYHDKNSGQLKRLTGDSLDGLKKKLYKEQTASTSELKKRTYLAAGKGRR